MSRPRQASHLFDVRVIRSNAKKQQTEAAPIFLADPTRGTPPPAKASKKQEEKEPDFNEFINMIVEERPKQSKVRKIFKEYVNALNESAEIF